MKSALRGYKRKALHTPFDMTVSTTWTVSLVMDVVDACRVSSKALTSAVDAEKLVEINTLRSTGGYQEIRDGSGAPQS